MSSQKEITLLAIIIMSATATEFTSNTSISSIFIPIVNSIVKYTFLIVYNYIFK